MLLVPLHLLSRSVLQLLLFLMLVPYAFEANVHLLSAMIAQRPGLLAAYNFFIVVIFF